MLTRSSETDLISLLMRDEVQVHGKVLYTTFTGCHASISKSGELVSRVSSDPEITAGVDVSERSSALNRLVELLTNQSVSVDGQIICTDGDESVEVWKTSVGVYVKYLDPKSYVTYLHRDRGGISSRHLLTTGRR